MRAPGGRSGSGVSASGTGAKPAGSTQAGATLELDCVDVHREVTSAVNGGCWRPGLSTIAALSSILHCSLRPCPQNQGPASPGRSIVKLQAESRGPSGSLQKVTDNKTDSDQKSDG